MRIPAICFMTLVLTGVALSQEGVSYKPKAGYVPDAATAIRIAEAVLVPVYGKKQIDSEHPFSADLKNGIWIVGGTLGAPMVKEG